MNTQNIIGRIKQKERGAEKALFVHFAPKVMTICRRYASQDAEAKDFLQECFLLIFSKIDQYDSAKGSFEGWIHRVSTNRILELYRKSTKQVKMTYPDTLPEPILSQESFQMIPRQQILEAVQQLPQGYRQVFNLYIFEGWSHKQIGAALNIAETTSRSQLNRAKRILKNKLQKKITIQGYERKLA